MPTKFIKCGFEDHVVREDGFYNILLNGKRVGFNLDLRINYYRGLPLSSVRTLEISIDDKKIPEQQIIVELNGKTFSVRQLKELYAEFWGIKTPMHLRVFNGGLEEGGHDVAATIIYQSPYMEFASGVYGQIDGSGSKRMKIGEGREFP